ncbi:hypothetical protein COOONC_13241 [Cooperia oncophora]
MVRVNKSFSSPRSAPSGVPQGGVLSPLLFNIYTFELPLLITGRGVDCVAFADDVKLYRAVGTEDERGENSTSSFSIRSFMASVVSVLIIFVFCVHQSPGEALSSQWCLLPSTIRSRFFTIRAGTDYFKLNRHKSFPASVKAFSRLIDRYMVP